MIATEYIKEKLVGIAIGIVGKEQQNLENYSKQ